jgi:hypothetical protein
MPLIPELALFTFISKSLGLKTRGLSTYEKKEYLAVLIAGDH